MAEPIAMILAGGQGSRLSILSEHRAKPAVPFGSNYRIIDFVISNVMQSDIRYVGILTQYKPYSLMTHIGMGESWGFSGQRSKAKILPPYAGNKAQDWYAGTADAIYQNVDFVDHHPVFPPDVGYPAPVDDPVAGDRTACVNVVDVLGVEPSVALGFIQIRGAVLPFNRNRGMRGSGPRLRPPAAVVVYCG